ncbi:MAG: hypothetical protein DMF61_04645 [Blastocatellia bacterium AA13]|nr:MAG: hypothetical protein DMF61_04645 [Blastocatellia bacterium AA13]
MARLRAILLLALWFGGIAFIAPFVIALFLLTKKENVIYGPVRLFIRAGLFLVGIKVEVSGLDRLDPARTYLFTPNHQSFIEVPLLIAYLGRNPAYLAKKELFKYPIFGYGIGLIGIVPVDRGNSKTAVASAQLAAANLRKGKDYIVYPEGTRSRDGRLLPFKKGAFVMAIKAGAPIVPVTVSGCTAVMPKGEVKVYPATVRITIHDPIETKGCSREAAPELLAETRAKILSALSEDNVRSESKSGQ